MSHDDNSITNDPDVFARELQHALFVEGPRSRSIRRLNRVARDAPGAELERIFETKLAELKRFHRENRQPTLWNLPLRAFEWLWDHARFMPPREAFMTLVYVVLVLVGIEVFKGRLAGTASSSRELASDRDLFQLSPLQRIPYSNRPATQEGDSVTARVDDWFVSKLSEAARSTEFQGALAEQIQSQISEAKIADQIRDEVDALLTSEPFRKLVQRRVDEALEQAVPSQALLSAIRDASNTDEFRKDQTGLSKESEPEQ